MILQWWTSTQVKLISTQCASSLSSSSAWVSSCCCCQRTGTSASSSWTRSCVNTKSQQRTAEKQAPPQSSTGEGDPGPPWPLHIDIMKYYHTNTHTRRDGSSTSVSVDVGTFDLSSGQLHNGAGRVSFIWRAIHLSESSCKLLSVVIQTQKQTGVTHWLRLALFFFSLLPLDHSIHCLLNPQTTCQLAWYFSALRIQTYTCGDRSNTLQTEDCHVYTFSHTFKVQRRIPKMLNAKEGGGVTVVPLNLMTNTCLSCAVHSCVSHLGCPGGVDPVRSSCVMGPVWTSEDQSEKLSPHPERSGPLWHPAKSREL